MMSDVVDVRNGIIGKPLLCSKRQSLIRSNCLTLKINRSEFQYCDVVTLIETFGNVSEFSCMHCVETVWRLKGVRERQRRKEQMRTRQAELY